MFTDIESVTFMGPTEVARQASRASSVEPAVRTFAYSVLSISAVEHGFCKPAFHACPVSFVNKILADSGVVPT